MKSVAILLTDDDLKDPKEGSGGEFGSIGNLGHPVGEKVESPITLASHLSPSVDPDPGDIPTNPAQAKKLAPKICKQIEARLKKRNLGQVIFNGYIRPQCARMQKALEDAFAKCGSASKDSEKTIVMNTD